MWHLIPTVNGWKSLLLLGFPRVHNSQNSVVGQFAFPQAEQEAIRPKLI
jgi:hypothetical protein